MTGKDPAEGKGVLRPLKAESATAPPAMGEEKRSSLQKSAGSKFMKSEYVRLAALGLLGILLLVLGSSLGISKPKTASPDNIASLRQYEELLSREVERAVSVIKGAGKVYASVTLEAGPQNVYARNVSRSSTSQVETGLSGERRENSSTSESSQPVSGRFGSSDSPMVEQVLPARIAGCLVIAEGASSSAVKADIYQAVSALLGIPLYRIQVVPMKGGK